MDIKQVRDLTRAYGWHEIPSKNPHMISFKREEGTVRLDIYYTTGTFSLNDKGRNRWFRERDLFALEKEIATVR